MTVYQKHYSPASRRGLFRCSTPLKIGAGPALLGSAFNCAMAGMNPAMAQIYIVNQTGDENACVPTGCLLHIMALGYRSPIM